MRRSPILTGLILTILALATLGAGLAGVAAWAQQSATYTDPAEARRALREARRQGAAARLRAEQLETVAAAAGAAAQRSAAAAAAAAARIQQAEAGVAAQEANLALLDRQREDLRARLARRQQPLLRLTAALQRLSRRPLLFSLFRPGSVRDSMHLSAMLATMLPEVSRRTADLRDELDKSRALKDRAERAIAALRQEQADLATRRTRLAAMETQARLAARQSAGVADREADRALALAEQARDLSALTDSLGRAGRLREQLARLDGPVIRPASPDESRAPLPQAQPATEAAVLPVHPAPAFLLPVQGRLVAGFGAQVPGSPRSRGVAIAARPGAQAIAPGPGRVAFAGPYRGFGQIAIIDHGDGWTSLVTGLARLDVRVGQNLVAGSPLGRAGPGRPVIGLELRREGEPVNPLDFAKL